MQGTDGKGQLGGLVDIDDVAGMLGVGVRHVRRLVADRRIPVEIEAWIDQSRRPVRPEVVAVPALRIGGARRVRRWPPPDAG